MPHNVDLPKHRYVWVHDEFIYNKPEGKLVPAVWFGVSSHPGRSIGCHVLLESGASVIDLPLSALVCKEDAQVSAAPIGNFVGWDCFGWDMQTFEPDYLTGMSAIVLDEDREHVYAEATAWFAIDWIENGWSDYPEQHKWLWVLGCDNGMILAMPQDRVLFYEASFTDSYGKIPDGGIKRQHVIWKAEE